MQESKKFYRIGVIKNLKMLTQSQFSQVRFSAKLSDLRDFYNNLRAINFEKSAIFELSFDGLKVIVENCSSIQANFYVTRQCFSEFNITEEDLITFGVDLNTIVECLGIFAKVQCTMKMIYKGSGAPLAIILEQSDGNDVLTECSFKTKRYDEPLSYSINEEGSTFNFIILKGRDLANLFRDIDNAAEKLEILLSPKSPYFQISTIGVTQAEADIAVNKSSSSIINFRCKGTTKMQYTSYHIKTLTKSLQMASKVVIRTDSTGLLNLQVMTMRDESAQMYIEYFICPLVDYD